MQIYSENSFNNVSFMSAESALTAVYYSSVYTHSQVWRTRLKHANRRLTRGSIGVLFRQEGLSISPLLVTRYTAPCTFQMKNRDGDVPRDYAYQEPPIDHQLSGWQCMSSICLWRTDGFRRQMMDKTRQMGINVEWSICEASKEKIKLFRVDESHLIRSDPGDIVQSVSICQVQAPKRRSVFWRICFDKSIVVWIENHGVTIL